MKAKLWIFAAGVLTIVGIAPKEMAALYQSGQPLLQLLISAAALLPALVAVAGSSYVAKRYLLK
jgi:hypothetical protein